MTVKFLRGIIRSMNQVITIPKKIAQKGQLIIIPRDEYEAMLHSLKEQSRLILQKKILDAELLKATKEYKSGKYYGPFETAEEGIGFLKSRRVKK